MERHNSRKSLLEIARRSIANDARLHANNDMVPSVEVEPSLAAGGLSPSTAPAASRSKFSMLPTAAAIAPGVETISPIFGHSSAAPNQSFGSDGLHATQKSLANVSSNKRPSMAFTDETGRSFSPFANPDVNLVKRKYKEHTVEEYAAMQEAFRHNRFGGLGADDSPEKQRAREARKKVLEYGNGVSQLNLMLRATSDDAGGATSRSPSPTAGGGASPLHGRRAEIAQKKSQMIERALNEDGQIAKLKRERALMYGDILQQQRNQIVAGRRSPTALSGGSSPEPMVEKSTRRSFASPPPTDEALEELKRLQARHRDDYERIIQLKKELGVATATTATT